MRFLLEAYIFIGTLFLIAVLIQARFSVWKKALVTVLFVATVIIAEMVVDRPQWLQIWWWKMRTLPSEMYQK